MLVAGVVAGGLGVGGELCRGAGVGSGCRVVGCRFIPKAVELKFSKLNPVTNWELFSLRSATRLVKSLVPAAVMVVLGWGALKALMCRCR